MKAVGRAMSYLDKDRWLMDVVADVKRPVCQANTEAAHVVEDGRPGATAV
jgi:hypothetical protein